MPKSKVRPAKHAAAPTPGSGRRGAASHDAAETAAKKTSVGSASMRLAAEVDRLRAELATARAQVAQLEARADIDALLGIPNRRGFERELRRSLAYVRRYGTKAALVYLDLDNFKPVNDRFGHAAGDRVLQAVAAALRGAVRESDVVARLGGDEIGVLLWNVSEAQAAAKTAGLETAVLSAIVMHEGVVLSVGASAGFAMLQPQDTPAEIISRADLAMYARKRALRAATGMKFG